MKLNSAYLTIPVSNFNNSVDWYGEHFGFKVTTVDPNYIELNSCIKPYMKVKLKSVNREKTS